MSEQNQNQTPVETTSETPEQKRDANVQGVDSDVAQKVNDDKISQLTKESEEARKEVETARKRIAELNKDDTSKRFKIDELEKTIKTTEERDALLQKELETLRQQNSSKEKSFIEQENELNTLKAKLKSLEEQQQNANASALRQEEEKKAELIKQAETASKKQKDPDILTLVQNAPDNATRELLLSKLKNKKIDTIKVTGLSTISTSEGKNINLLSANISDLSKLKDEDPELYEDIINNAKRYHSP